MDEDDDDPFIDGVVHTIPINLSDQFTLSNPSERNTKDIQCHLNFLKIIYEKSFKLDLYRLDKCGYCEELTNLKNIQNKITTSLQQLESLEKSRQCLVQKL